jgi:predicted DNA-binding protein
MAKGTDFTIPLVLATKIQAAADEDHRTPGDLVREALEHYMEDREWRQIFAYGEARARALGLTEEDVPRLIAEYRQGKRQAR